MNSTSQRAFLVLCFASLLVSPQAIHADPLRDCDRLEDPARAMRACSKLLSVFPGNAVLHNKRGAAYIENGQVDLAIADYTEAIRLGPKVWQPYYNRGRALLGKNAYVEAISDFNEAISLKPRNALTRNGRAWALFKLGLMPAALEDANHAIAADPTYAAAYDTRAHVYEVLGHREKAVADFRKALMLEPHNPLAHITREGLARWLCSALS